MNWYDFWKFKHILRKRIKRNLHLQSVTGGARWSAGPARQWNRDKGRGNGQWFLTIGEESGDEDGTTVIHSLSRIDWGTYGDLQFTWAGLSSGMVAWWSCPVVHQLSLATVGLGEGCISFEVHRRTSQGGLGLWEWRRWAWLRAWWLGNGFMEAQTPCSTPARWPRVMWLRLWPTLALSYP
jgi:hypothetical protein